LHPKLKPLVHQPDSLLVIIPCYNEAASIGSLLSQICALQQVADYNIDVAVVNDASKDSTASIVAQYPVALINLPVNLGIGGAMQTGFMYARKKGYQLALQMDGDGQHPPAELKKLLERYRQSQANVIIGSRFLEKTGFQSTAIRKKGIAYFHWLNRLLTGKHIYDSTSGFRLLDGKAIDIAASNYPDEYPEPESLVIFARHGLHIEEVPVEMKQRQGGVSSINSISAVYYCFKVTLAMLFSFIRK
jgi:glycosyltransferase involved in cell wall biosynthesis